jgi:mannose-1-phosphate guanylyltransferase
MTKKTLSKDRFIIIMAGGRGERFWPVSREKTPKQLITILGERSFLQRTVDRVLPIAPAENVIIITNSVQAKEVRRQLPELPSENVVAEPCGRDTCAAVALGAALVGARSKSGVMAVLPADHVIPSEKKFQRVLMDALDFAASDPRIVTIGITPTEPATGYGYVQVGDPLETKKLKTAVYAGKKFVEKPNHAKAVRYVKSGQYRWNAGMFIWSFETIYGALSTHQPEMAQACDRWMNAESPAKLNRILAKEYPAITKISIDFALMEKAKNFAVVDGAFGWDDLGAWTALARHLKADKSGNCAVGDIVQIDSSNNIVFDGRMKRRTPIALVGVKDSIIVQTDDALLVASKSEAQKIKQLVAALKDHAQFSNLV